MIFKVLLWYLFMFSLPYSHHFVRFCFIGLQELKLSLGQAWKLQLQANYTFITSIHIGKQYYMITYRRNLSLSCCSCTYLFNSQTFELDQRTCKISDFDNLYAVSDKRFKLLDILYILISNAAYLDWSGNYSISLKIFFHFSFFIFIFNICFHFSFYHLCVYICFKIV